MSGFWIEGAEEPSPRPPGRIWFWADNRGCSLADSLDPRLHSTQPSGRRRPFTHSNSEELMQVRFAGPLPARPSGQRSAPALNRAQSKTWRDPSRPSARSVRTSEASRCMERTAWHRPSESRPGVCSQQRRGVSHCRRYSDGRSMRHACPNWALRAMEFAGEDGCDPLYVWGPTSTLGRVHAVLAHFTL